MTDTTIENFDPADPPRGVAIPLYSHTQGNAEALVGAGFVVRHQQQLKLLTAAHVPTGRQPVKTAGWVGWPSLIGAPLSVAVDGEHLAVRLFDLSSVVPRPLFTYLSDDATGSMADMMAFYGPEHSAVLDRLASVMPW
jgi:hypothetical protein